MTISVLGTPYSVIVKKYDEEPAFARRNIRGFCDGYAKEIVVCDVSTFAGWEHEAAKTIIASQNETLRHEIVHAFLNESGLSGCSLQYESGWATNEELVDWLAIQGPKLFAAWQEAGVG